MAVNTNGSPWRHFLGLVLLGVVIILWTTSSFITSAMFADDTYSKPYFVTYINTAFFSMTLIPFFIRHLYRNDPRLRNLLRPLTRTPKPAHPDASDHMSRSIDSLLHNNDHADATESLELSRNNSHASTTSASAGLDVRETFRLATKFCCFWFAANWTNAASFAYTSVASSTILVSTSSVFTLLLSAALGVERFTIKKLLGVAASLGGVTLITLLDARAEQDDPSRGDFPWKSPGEVALGNAFALCSAVLYGVYATTLTKVVGDESRVNMPLFFGFVGVVATVCLWPGIIILHLIGMEAFELPPTHNIWGVLLVNAAISLVSDVAWAYAVLMTSPLVVTVGLSLTIPLSLIGQMLVHGQYSSVGYWLGAVIVVVAFVFINHESKVDGDTQVTQTDEG